MGMHTTPAFEILLVAIALQGVTPTARAQDVDVRAVETLMEGRELTAEQAAEQEKRLVTDPDDIDSRARLLGYYWARQFAHPEEAATRQGHIFWIIDNAPGSAVAGSVDMMLHPPLEPGAFQEGSRLWRKQVENHAGEATDPRFGRDVGIAHPRERRPQHGARARARRERGAGRRYRVPRALYAFLEGGRGTARWMGEGPPGGTHPRFRLAGRVGLAPPTPGLQSPMSHAIM